MELPVRRENVMRQARVRRREVKIKMRMTEFARTLRLGAGVGLSCRFGFATRGHEKRRSSPAKPSVTALWNDERRAFRRRK